MFFSKIPQNDRIIEEALYILFPYDVELLDMKHKLMICKSMPLLLLCCGGGGGGGGGGCAIYSPIEQFTPKSFFLFLEETLHYIEETFNILQTNLLQD